MRFRGALIATVALTICADVVHGQGAAEDPEQAARDFLYALYANDVAAFHERIIPEAGSSVLLGTQTFTRDQLESLRKDISRLELRPVSPPTLDGTPLPDSSRAFPGRTKMVYFTQFRGVVMAVPMQRVDDAWKVDVRYWLAMRKQVGVRPQKTDPEYVAKGRGVGHG